MKPISSALAGVGAGVTVAYFLDPTSGPRRRAGVRDTFAHSAVITRRAIGATSRDVAHRAQGTAASLRRLIDSRAPDDAIVVERVRAQLGRLLSHPRAVDVFARDGVVTLAGPVL
jgi:hypothetical protein